MEGKLQTALGMEEAKAVTDEIDIYRAATELIKQHGKDAAIHAAMRADELMAAGDVEGQRVWKRIIRVIDELSSKETPEKSKVH